MFNISKYPTVIILISVFFTMLAGFIVMVVVEYKKKQINQKRKLREIESQFQTELIKAQIEVQESTRKTLAADLHDSIGQILSLTKSTLETINIKNDNKTQERITATRDLVMRAIDELRQLSKLLHGEQLMKQGLPKAIEQEVKWLQKSGYYTVNYSNYIDESAVINKDKSLFLYRLLQEAINNIIKHAEARIITITLKLLNNTIYLTIVDNGKGFSTNDSDITQQGLGLYNMQHRIALLNGKISIESNIGLGTKIIFSVPFS